MYKWFIHTPKLQHSGDQSPYLMPCINIKHCQEILINVERCSKIWVGGQGRGILEEQEEQV